MAFVKSVLIAIGVATLQAAADEMHHDTVTLLQASVKEKSRKLVSEPDSEPAQAYELKDPLECASEKTAPLLQYSQVEITAPAAEKLSLIDATSSSDPAGANAFKATIHFMIVLLIVDAMRRWHLQKQQQAPESAWIDMVNAAKEGNVDSFNAALHGKPRLAQADAWGCTPLHFAAAGGSVGIVSMLLKAGVDIEALDGNDETPLHFAARAGHASICEMLSEAGAKAGGVHGMADKDVPPCLVSQLVQKVFVPGEVTDEWVEDED